MPFEFQCHCGKLLSAEDDWVGTHARCPFCQLLILVPKAETPAGGAAADSLHASAAGSDEPGAVSMRRVSLNSNLVLNVLGITGLLLLALSAFLLGRSNRSRVPASPPIAAGPAAEGPATPPQEPDRGAETGASEGLIGPPSRATATAVPASTGPSESTATMPERGEQAAGVIAPVGSSVELITATIPASRAAATVNASMARPFAGRAHQGLHLPDGRQVALFLDPTRPGIRPGAQTRASRQLLAKIALNADDLRFYLGESLNLTRTAGSADSPAGPGLHVVVFPLEGQVLSDTDDFVAFGAAAVRSWRDLRSLSGQVWQEEPWPSGTAVVMGLMGPVHWFGDLGVALSTTQSITHVLLRGPILSSQD